MMFLIDTDIIIYALNGNTHVVDNLQRYAAKPKAISAITYGELLFGAMKSQRREENTARVRHVGELFLVVDVSRAIIETFSSLKTSLQQEGRPLQDFDLLIAATALNLDYERVTNNEKHFYRIPKLKVANWAKPTP